ncbi:MAG TPA: M20/M25/M40 family metallo-hydrolase [Candidatus Eisenbacteria bacterium]|nr:M20/M25/M40 family metallo-hydrolase [Candidatus Eisenbacteria bacterium]
MKNLLAPLGPGLWKMWGSLGWTLALASLAGAASQASGASRSQDPKAAERELHDLLSELIAVDTSDPPGNEMGAAQVLRAHLEREGIACQIFEPDSGRANLVARLPGNGRKRPLLLLGHIDVVPVQKERWTSEPFRMTERDGYYYGRGVIDDKGMVAACAMTLILLKRSGMKLDRDIILLAECDEEAGGERGISWMLEHHKDVIDAEFALNEGGRVLLEGGQVRWVGLQNAEKRAVNIQLTAKGSSGHASMPRPDNPLVLLSRAVLAASQKPFPVQLTPETREFFPAVAALEPDSEMAAAMRSVVDPDPARAEAAAQILAKDLMFGAMIRHTVSPTLMSAGIKSNVIPSTAEATLNVRMIPGTDPAVLADSIRARIGDSRVEVSYTPPTRSAAPSSPFSGPVVEAVRRSAAKHFPKAPVVPLLSTGATDSSELRREGIPSYGLLIFPLETGDVGRMHADDERMPVSSLGTGLWFLHDTVLEAAH